MSLFHLFPSSVPRLCQLKTRRWAVHHTRGGTWERHTARMLKWFNQALPPRSPICPLTPPYPRPLPPLPLPTQISFTLPSLILPSPFPSTHASPLLRPRQPSPTPSQATVDLLCGRADDKSPWMCQGTGRRVASSCARSNS